MPSEPDNKMDDLLRTYARKRREDAGASPELHPATRRLLQAEAASLRFRPAASPKRGWTWLAAYWPRVAIPTGLFAVLAVVAWQVMPSRERSGPPLKLAKAEHTFEAKAPVPEPVAAPADKLDLFTKPTPKGLETGRERQTATTGTLKDSSDLESNRRGRANVPNRLLGPVRGLHGFAGVVVSGA